MQAQEQLNRIRIKLNSNKVKLWLTPYVDESGATVLDEIKRLSDEFSNDMQISPDDCLSALLELQTNALDKLKSRKKFEESGVANFKIRIPSSSTISVDEKLTSLGSELLNQVSEILKIPVERIKLVHAGKILVLNTSLQDQGLSNGQKLLAIVMEVDPKQNKASESIHDRIRKAKEDASLLIENGNYMHMEDQHGNTVHLPPDERKAILMALAIHEKGKAALKRSNFNEALYLFLEADQEYSKCNSQLLKSVDNYALLYLDIVWCYVELKSADQLMDAERRLRLCEDQMVASYGPNLQRVLAIKGSSCNEKCLFMRLHLMQAIVLYHLGKRDEAKAKFNSVQTELNSLKINQDSVQVLTEMGFSETEARIALRETGGHVTNAINRIYQTRETRSEARKRGKKERKLGQRADDQEQWVNPKTLASLTEMGFDEEMAKVALSECQNDVTKALSLLSDAPEFVASKIDGTKKMKTESEIKLDKLMKSIVDLDFDQDLTAKMFVALKGQVQERREMLLQQIEQCEDDQKALALRLLDSLNDNNAPSSSASAKVQETENSKAKEEAKKLIERREAFARFAEDISSDDDDDYLDFPLEEEERLLVEYKSILDL